MYNSRGNELSSGPTLPAGWLSAIIPPSSTEDALLSMVGCPVPPLRPDLEGWTRAITKDYIIQQLDLITENLIISDNCPSDVESENLTAIACYTLEGSFYKLLNGWGNTPKRSMEDMKWIAPYLRILTESLRSLPSRMRYEGFGVSVLDASGSGYLNKAWKNYEEHFKVGKSVNFHSVVSFGYDERLLESFLDENTKPIIVLKCERIVGYKIDEISMMPRLGHKEEGEVLMEGPSFFQVERDPIKIKNYVVVYIKYEEESSKRMSYLPFQNINYIAGKNEYIKGIELLARFDLLKARKLFEISAAKKFPPSYERLHRYYSSCNYVEDNEKRQYWLDLVLKNEDWFERNKSSTDHVIVLSIALYLANVKKDDGTAFQYFKLCDQSNSTVQNCIGYRYRNGYGVEKDSSEAVKYFKLAADQGNVLGQYNVAGCYEEGRGVLKDMKEAKKYYKLAADRGHSHSLNKLQIL